METNVETLKEQARKIADKIGKIEDAERYEQNKELEGRTFKFRNCYSCSEKPSDYWWLYTKVTKVTRDHIHVHQFQTDKYGEITISLDKTYYRHVPLHDRTEIKPAEFERQWKAMKKRIADNR